MRAKRLFVVLVCVLVVGALLPVSAVAAFQNYRSATADAYWSSWNWENGEPGPDDAVVDWGVSGWTARTVWKDAGVSVEQMRETSGVAYMMSFTPASGDSPRTWVEFTCFATPVDFAIAKQLNSAGLDFTAEGVTNIWYGDEPWYEQDGEFLQRDPDATKTEMVNVMSDWKATGPLSRSSFVMKERSADYFMADRSNQTYRDAKANVSVVGADSGLIFGDPAVPGSIYDVKGVSRFPFMAE